MQPLYHYPIVRRARCITRGLPRVESILIRLQKSRIAADGGVEIVDRKFVLFPAEVNCSSSVQGGGKIPIEIQGAIEVRQGQVVLVHSHFANSTVMEDVRLVITQADRV